MIACYCRVSSRSQKTDSQKAEVTRWLQHQGLDVAAVRWFEDIERGQTLRRPKARHNYLAHRQFW